MEYPERYPKVERLEDLQPGAYWSLGIGKHNKGHRWKTINIRLSPDGKLRLHPNSNPIEIWFDQYELRGPIEDPTMGGN